MKVSLSVVLVGVAILTQGCAHNSLDDRIAAKVSQESTVKHRADLGVEAAQLIASSTSLNEQQKSQLLALQDTVRDKTDSLIGQSLKLRSVLIKDLISSYDEDEVALVKKKIKEIEEKRVTVLFDAVERANKILGHEAAANQRMIRNFMQFDGAHGY